MRNPRPGTALAIVAIVGVLATGCSSPETMPTQFEGMSSDEVGCVIAYGDSDFEVGPLGPSDAVDTEPNLYTTFRLGRTAMDLIVVADRASDGSTGSQPISEISPDGTVVAWRGLADSGNPAYEITCWRGTA